MNTPAAQAITNEDVVRSISFGSRVAEDEADDLSTYFVRTEAWRQVRSGEVDVVLAPKGGGKSAIYSMLAASEDDLFNEKILLASAENMTGTPAFQSLTTEASLTEAHLVGIWKLYFLVLISAELESYDIRSEEAKKLFEHLRDADLLPEKRPRTTLLAVVKEYVARLFTLKSAETGVSVDPVTGGVTGFTGKIEFGEPSVAASKAGHVSIATLYEHAEGALKSAGYKLWITLDRLDAAFAAHPSLERDALRALFRVYSDLASLSRIRLKIFLRSDIWESITDDGFREASHIVRDTEISWNSESLRQLIVRRLTRSAELLKHYGRDEADVMSTTQAQEDFFYEIFAPQVDAGSGKTATWDWCLSRTQDGTGISAPRELIHLFSETRSAQLKRHETGQSDPEPPSLFHPRSFVEALPSVSNVRLTRTVYAEFTDAKPYIEALAGQKAEQNLESLGTLWALDASSTEKVCRRLVQIGFFTEKKKSSTFWVPFIYRPALEMIQGKADAVKNSDQATEE